MLSLLAAGCSLSPDPLTTAENEKRAAEDLVAIYKDYEPVSGPVTLYEAMARSIRYNLENRLKVMEQALAQRQVDLTRFDLLPTMTARAGYEGRNNFSGATSQSLLSGRQSLEPSTSQERDRLIADLSTSWNVLDFGVSYVRARQQTNRALIADERRRKVIQNIIQDVRTTYYLAVSADSLLQRIDPLMAKVETALADSRRNEQQLLQPPIEALTYQRSLLDTLRELHALRRDLTPAKAQLAAAMNLKPTERFALAQPGDYAVPRVEVKVEQLERLALLHRPELLEEAYQTRIGSDETMKEILRSLPGIELNLGQHYDTNNFLFNNTWHDYSLRITWNVLNLLSTPYRIAASEAQEDVIVARRRALTAAAISQVHIALLRYGQAISEFRNANEMSDVEERIFAQLRSAGAADRRGQLEVIRAELNAVLAQLRRDATYAEVQNALGRIFSSAGADPLPAAVPAVDVKTLGAAIRDRLEGWYSGRVELAALIPELPGAAPKPGTPARRKASPAPAAGKGAAIAPSRDPAPPRSAAASVKVALKPVPTPVDDWLPSGN